LSIVAPAANHCDILLANTIGFQNFLGFLRRDFAQPDSGQHIVAEIGGEVVGRVVCAFVGIGDLLGRASALGVKLASEDGGSIADVAAEL
jgi:hypothetical protein